jgi:WD40 repeat protein
MKVLKILIVAAVLLTAFTQLQAIPDAPILQVDTLVNLSKTGGGVAGGALFLPDGNIIALWKSIPHVIDSKTGEVIRRMDTVHSSLLHEPRLTINGLRLGGISMGPKLNVWDVPSGKIIFQTIKKMMSFCFSPDGTKMYVTLPNDADNPGTIVIYDMATFEEIDRLSYPNMTWGSQIDISPDGQTLAVSVGYKVNDTFSNKFILINLSDKQNYTTIESLKLQINSMEFSPDGKQVAFVYNGADGENYIYIYNLNTMEKKLIRLNELSALLGINVKLLGQPSFIDDNTILFEASDWPITKTYHLSLNIKENRIKCIINLINNFSVDIKDSTILLCNQRGVIGYLNKTIAPVKDLVIPKENNITYKNSQLVYFSDEPFIGESYLYDINGKLIAYLGTQLFKSGKNTLSVNLPLLNNIYLLTIISDTEQISKKFLVER